MSHVRGEGAARVQAALTACGLACRVAELPESTRSAEDAARAIGCRVEQIVKSLVFRGARTGRPILVVASGRNHVDEKRLGELVGEPIAKADAHFVLEKTGYAIGGVPQLGHSEPLDTWIDADLLQQAELWAAAGTPHAVFRLTPADLQQMTRGRVVAIQ